MALASQPAIGEEEFPLVGAYWKDLVCIGDGSQRPDLLVRITPKQIESTMGTCNILKRNRAGQTLSVQMECTLPGNQKILGDAIFTLRADKNLDFADEDHTSDAILHRCSP